VDLQLPRKDVYRILICRVTHSLGNTLCTTPLLRELSKVYPGAEIDLVTRSPVAQEIFGNHPAVRRIFRLPAHGVFHPMQYARLLRTVRSTWYDLVIDPCTRSGTDRAWTAAVRGHRKLGFAKGRLDGCLTHAVQPFPDIRHTAHRSVALLRSALCGFVDSTFPALNIGLTDLERAEGKRAVEHVLGEGQSADKPIIGIFANATGTKLLPEGWWQTFLDELEKRYPNAALIEFVPAFGQSMLGSRYPAYYTSDIRRMAATLSALSLLITADCGVMHLASAAGTPIAAFFNVTDPKEWGPYGPHDIVLDTRVKSPLALASCIRLPSICQ
jgi:ADP-heptose:LPS heptosyltransferase